MRFLAIFLLFLFAVAGSAFVAQVGLRGSVEEELGRKSLELLSGAGFGGVTVAFDHLDGSLSGTVDRPEDVATVVRLLREGVPTAYWPEPEATRIGIRPTLPPRLTVSREEDSDRVRVEGALALAEDAGRSLLGSRLHALPDVAGVDNEAKLDAMVRPFPKMAEFASLASGILAHPGAAEVVLLEGKLAVSGTVPNEGLKKGLLDLAAQIGAESLDDGIRVKPPQTFTRVAELRLTRNRFGVVLGGVLPSEADRVALLELFRAADAKLLVTDRIEVSDTCAPAAWQERLAEAIPALLAGLGGEMTAEFGETQIRVSGTATDDKARQTFLDRLVPLRTGPPAFELVADIATEGGSRESAVSLTAVYEGGLLVLSGKVSDPGFATALEAKLKGPLPDTIIKNELETVPATPGDAWTAGLAEFFAETLPRLSAGKFVFQDGVLDLEGRTVSLPDRQVVQNLAVNLLPPAFKIQNRLLHADQPFPKPTLLPEARIKLAETLKALPIYFDKNSDALQEEGKAKVASVAEAVKAAAAEIDLVVTGFADNVGNAASNERLSLRRAAAVRAELVRLGLPEAAISVVSEGEDVSDVPSSERWKSRRVEVSPKPANEPVTRDP